MPPEFVAPKLPLRGGAYAGEICAFVTAPDGVAWTAALAGGSGWLTITDGTTGTGCDLITLKTTSNTGGQRTAQLTATDSRGKILLETSVVQASADPLAALNKSVLALPEPPVVPRLMELGILGKWAASEIAKVPEPFTALVLAIVLLVVQLIGVLAIALRAALAVIIPEPETWFGAPGPYDAMTKFMPANAVYIQEQTDLLTIYLPIEVATGE